MKPITTDSTSKEIMVRPMTDIKIETQLKIMAEPTEEQKLVDQLSALVLTGEIDCYAAKDATECEDWERARRLIEEAKHDRN